MERELEREGRKKILIWYSRADYNESLKDKTKLRILIWNGARQFGGGNWLPPPPPPPSIIHARLENRSFNFVVCIYASLRERYVLWLHFFLVNRINKLAMPDAFKCLVFHGVRIREFNKVETPVSKNLKKTKEIIHHTNTHKIVNKLTFKCFFAQLVGEIFARSYQLGREMVI